MEKERKYIIAAIYGSPRFDGNTAVLMDRFLEGAEDGALEVGRKMDLRKDQGIDAKNSSLQGMRQLFQDRGVYSR